MRTRAHAGDMGAALRGCVLLIGASMCAWPRVLESSPVFCGRQPSQSRELTLRQRAVEVDNAEEQATLNALSFEFSQPTNFEVGQNVSGRVKVMKMQGPSLAYVDIGAEKDAILEYGEMEDGYPARLSPVRPRKQIYARILEYLTVG